MNSLEQVKEKILQLEQAMLQLHPRMPLLLQEIRTHLKQDPDVVTLLEEEEIQKIVTGLMRQTATEIATTVAKSAKTSLKNITINDL